MTGKQQFSYRICRQLWGFGLPKRFTAIFKICVPKKTTNLVWLSVCSVLLYDSLLTWEYPFYLALGFPLKSLLLFNKLRQPETSVELITYRNLLTLPVQSSFLSTPNWKLACLWKFAKLNIIILYCTVLFSAPYCRVWKHNNCVQLQSIHSHSNMKKM